MKSPLQLLALTALVLVGSRVGLLAQADAVEKPRLDPKAESIMRKAGKRIQELKHITFEVIDTIDVVRETGQKVQYSHRRKATVSRPDKLAIESTGDVMNMNLYKDGSTITLLDKDRNVYAQMKDPGTIDQMIDTMQERFGVSTPLADLLSADPAKVLLEGVESGLYLGVHHVDEHACHHIACRGETLDWQVWIDAGENPLLRKLVITYKQQPGAPQYTLKQVSSTPLDSVPAAAFQFEPPAGCEKIEFLPLSVGTGALEK
jgi:hypothetical protein